MKENKEELKEETEEVEVKEDKKDYTKLIEQINNEYETAWQHMSPKFEKWRANLKTFNNQKRKDADAEAIGDTTMFSVFQTLLASLYQDRLSVEFLGREEGDEETAYNLTQMAEFDYTEMKKAQVDYDWDWNTLFFGRALVSTEEFVREPEKLKFYMQPEAIDPLTWLRDPNATSVHGNAAGKGAMRYGGRPVLMSVDEMEEHPSFFGNTKYSELSTTYDIKSILEKGKKARDEAQGRQNENRDKIELGENQVYPIIEWFTKYDGKKTKVWLDEEKKTVLGLKECEDDEFPFVDRALFPEAGDWDGTSIPDLTEDKQRARAVLLNLAKRSMKADLYPMYLFDEDKITNRNDLNFGFNKFIPGKGKGESIANAVAPIQKPTFNLGMFDLVYRAIEDSAQKATATTGVQQGQLVEGNKTLGEIDAAKGQSDVRFSLSAKIWGWSEQMFSLMWYKRYKNNFADGLDKKVLRIVGANGAKWRKLSKKDIQTKVDPDVKVVSKFLKDQEDTKDRTLLSQYFQLALQDPTTDRRYALRKLGSLNGLAKDELDMLQPPTIDELVSEKENESLNVNSLTEPNVVVIKKDQDHNIHIRMHGKAKDSDATYKHIEAHKEALAIKQSNPEFFNKNEMEAEFSGEEELAKPVPKTDVNSVLK